MTENLSYKFRYALSSDFNRDRQGMGRMKRMNFARVPFANRKVTKRNYLGYVFFTLFFCSGFCSLLYEVVWVRLAFALSV